MNPPKTILCAVDFSRHTEAAVAMGIRLAEGFKAGLILFHSVQFPSDTVHGSDLPERKWMRDQRTREAEDKIRALMAGSPVPWDFRIAWGDPVETLADVSERTGADLVLVASYGLSGVKRVLMGTVVERAVRRLTRPVLVLKSGRRQDMRCIVAACALFPQPDPVALFAWDMARRFQADLHLVHALERPIDQDIVDPTDGPYFQVQEEFQRRVRWLLMESVSDEARHLTSVHTAAEPGPPGEVLVAYARRHGADLAIVGVRRQGAVRKTIIGSTTEALVRNAPCAVLTVPLQPQTVQAP